MKFEKLHSDLGKVLSLVEEVSIDAMKIKSNAMRGRAYIMMRTVGFSKQCDAEDSDLLLEGIKMERESDLRLKMIDEIVKVFKKYSKYDEE